MARMPQERGLLCIVCCFGLQALVFGLGTGTHLQRRAPCSRELHHGWPKAEKPDIILYYIILYYNIIFLLFFVFFLLY